MFWKDKKVVVTGAGGFIGSHLVDELLSQGADVKAVVRYNSHGSIGNLKMVSEKHASRLSIVRTELRDLAEIRALMEGVDTVFHLAALVGIPYSYVNPQEVIENNVLSTLNLLLAAREVGVKKFIQTSTSEVYGSAKIVPIPETHPYQPQSPYSASKIATDSISLSFYFSFGVPVAVVRPFNTFGPRQSARAIIPTLISQAFKGGAIKIGVTNTTRDFTYVSDTVGGFLSVAESDNTVGEVFNLGTGREISIQDLASMVIKMVGKKVTLEQDSSRIRPDKSEVQRLCSDISKIKSVTGWSPKITFEEGLQLTIDWIEHNLASFKTDIYNI